MSHHTPHPLRHSVTDLWHFGYTGPAYLRGRPARDYLGRHRPRRRRPDPAA
ncbi:MAG: hypothetical protein ACLFXM_09345 [Acidimicrobiia bacterium]